MADEIIKELWMIKDKIAGEYGYDVKALVDYLRTKKRREDQLVVDLRSLKQTAKSVKEEVGTSSSPQHSP